MSAPTIAVFRGGVSPEREVSLGSGAAALEALRGSFAAVEDFDITGRSVPEAVRPDTHVVFLTLHGVFGEDGGMQGLLEAAGIEFAGCDAASSELCFDKWRTREAVVAAGVPVAPGALVAAEDAARAEALFEAFGPEVVCKPNRQGSSVGLRFCGSAAELRDAIAGAEEDGCVVERRIAGRELTVGLLDGEPLGVVEIRPKSGRFDYTSKYTRGLTEYLAPAPLAASVAARVRELARAAFRACGCRDFARIDFILGEDGPVMLEINTLPGLKETSLLPMSAGCVGIDFSELLRRMTNPALERFKLRQAAGGAAAPGHP